MSYIGRYHRVRVFSTMGAYSPPLILDRKNPARLLPYREDEPGFVRDPMSGRWVPTIAGGVGGNRNSTPEYALSPMIRDLQAAPQVTYTTLNTSYVFNSGGQAWAGRMTLPAQETLAKLYYYLSTVAGAPEVIVEVRRNNTANTPVTSGTLIASATDNPTGAGYRAVTFSHTIGGHATDHYVWFVLAVTNGSGSINAQFARNSGSELSSSAQKQTHTTSGGWATGNSTIAQVPCVTLVFSTGRAVGFPYITGSAASNNANRKGLRIDGLTAGVKIWQFLYAQSSGAPTVVEVRDTGAGIGSNMMTGISYQRIAGSAVGQGQHGFALAQSFSMPGSTPLYVVLHAEGSNFPRPSRWELGAAATGSVDDLKPAMLGDGNWYYAESDGTSGWPNNDLLKYPTLAWVLDDQIEAAGGGLLVHPGMSGGMRG